MAGIPICCAVQYMLNLEWIMSVSNGYVKLLKFDFNDIKSLNIVPILKTILSEDSLSAYNSRRVNT